MNDFAISEYILSMGLSASLALYVAFRAGRRLRGITPENMEEKVSDFTFDSLKELISNKLEELLGSQGRQLPARVSIQDVADQLHLDVEDLEILQNIYTSLAEQGIQSQYYMQAVAYVLQFAAGG